MSLLFSIRNIWLLCHQKYVIDRETFKDDGGAWVYTCYLFAVLLFWVQHWLYVSQYTKVSVMVPLTFCVQTNEVKEKRILWKTLLTIFDLAVYFTLVGIFVFELFDKENDEWFLGLFWNIISVIMSIALCVALQKIRLYSHDFATENLK